MNITFKSVIKLFRLLESNYNEGFKINKMLEVLGIDTKDITLETKAFILSRVMDYIFKNEEKRLNGEKIFDLELDYKYYWSDFLEKGINLNTQDLPYWEFDAVLESIFLKEKSTIGQVLTYRGYKKPSGNYKTYQNEEHKFYMQKKSQYALPQREKDLESGMEKLWDYVEQKSKERS